MNPVKLFAWINPPCMIFRFYIMSFEFSLLLLRIILQKTRYISFSLKPVSQFKYLPCCFSFSFLKKVGNLALLGRLLVINATPLPWKFIPTRQSSSMYQCFFALKFDFITIFSRKRVVLLKSLGLQYATVKYINVEEKLLKN